MAVLLRRDGHGHPCLGGAPAHGRRAQRASFLHGLPMHAHYGPRDHGCTVQALALLSVSLPRERPPTRRGRPSHLLQRLMAR